MVPPFRLEVREAGKDDWHIFDLAHTEQQAKTKLDRFNHSGLDGVEARVVSNVIEPRSDDISAHPKFQELQNFRHDIVAVFGSDDFTALKKIMADATQASAMESALSSEIERLKKELAGTKPDAITAASPMPFPIGGKLRDIHTGNIVRVVGIDVTGFTWAMGNQTGFCPIASCGCFEPYIPTEPESHDDEETEEGEEDSDPAAASAETGATVTKKKRRKSSHK